MSEHVHTVVIGAGQAGLTVSLELGVHGVEHEVFLAVVSDDLHSSGQDVTPVGGLAPFRFSAGAARIADVTGSGR